MITVAMYCHNFQRRLCWDLSSILQRTGDVPVYVRVAHLTGSGSPTTEATASPFVRAGMPLARFWWNPADAEEFQHRGLTRTSILRMSVELGSEWLLFTDCDMVYHPEYWTRLAAELEKRPEFPGILVAGRMSQDDPAPASELVDSLEYPCIVPDAWERAKHLRHVRRSAVGAGYFQLINVRHCPHGGYYSAKPEDHPWQSGKYWRTKSDHRFRRRIGNVERLPLWFTRNAVHLSHVRDNQTADKRHTEEQR